MPCPSSHIKVLNSGLLAPRPGLSPWPSAASLRLYADNTPEGQLTKASMIRMSPEIVYCTIYFEASIPTYQEGSVITSRPSKEYIGTRVLN